MIEKNCRQARYLAELIESEPMLELLAKPTLNIVCFRYCPSGEWPEDQLDELNQRIVAILQERGIAAPSTTVVRGKLAIRVAITNHRSQDEDFCVLATAILEIAREVLDPRV